MKTSLLTFAELDTFLSKQALTQDKKIFSGSLEVNRLENDKSTKRLLWNFYPTISPGGTVSSMQSKQHIVLKYNTPYCSDSILHK